MHLLMCQWIHQYILLSTVIILTNARPTKLVRRHNPENAQNGTGMYIVTWNPDINQSSILTKTSAISTRVFGSDGFKSLSEEKQPIQVNIGQFKATCLFLNQDAVSSLQNDSGVLWVEESVTGKWTGSIPVDHGDFYNLDMLDGGLDGVFNFPDNAGENTDIYILDSGLYAEHSAFEGRATVLAELVNRIPQVNGDTEGHGTHVAGTAGGSKIGVAQKASVIGVRIGNEKGPEPSAIIQGIEMVIQNAAKTQKPSVINLSLGFPPMKALDAAVEAAVKANIRIPVVIAAGNEKEDACKSSPGRVKSAITVAASDKSNKMAKFSNFGKCVDMFAPGVKIISASSKDPQKLLPEDGTSMASPLVAGVIAVMMSQGVPADQVRDTLINNAAKLSDAKNLRGTPNALVSFRNLLNSPAPPPPGQEGPPTGGDAPPAAGKEAPAPNKEVSPPPAGQETPPQNQEGNVNTSPQ